MNAEFAFFAEAFFVAAAADIEPTLVFLFCYFAEDTKINWKRSIFYIAEYILEPLIFDRERSIFPMKSAHVEKGKKKKKNPLQSDKDRENFLINLLLDIGQSHILDPFSSSSIDSLRKESLIKWLDQLDLFFKPMNGLYGLQKKIEKMLIPAKKKLAYSLPFEPHFLKFEMKKFLKGIELQDNLVEIIVLGGSAERLNFVDELSGEPLPAFLYPFRNRPLLEWMILDIEAKEKLYFEHFQKTTVTPIVLMTSMSKNNKDLLKAFLEKNTYFNRPKESFHFIEQPLVPFVDRDGKWCLDELGNVDKGPCGHGAIWSLLTQSKSFQELKKVRTHALIRQINNPLLCFFESTPLYLEAASGEKYDFSLLVTDPAPLTKEGKIIQKKGGRFTNVEYVHEHSLKLKGYANVNAIIVRLDVIEKYVQKDPFPGLLLNFKANDKARLEMSMQNLVDVIDRVLICHLPRKLAISAIKKEGVGIETAEEASVQLEKIFKKSLEKDRAESELTPYLSRKLLNK